MTFVSPFDFMPSMDPRRGQPEQSTKAAPEKLEAGAASQGEHKILRRLRSAGEPIGTIEALARETGLSVDATRIHVKSLEGRQLVRRASNSFGGDRYEAPRR